MSLTAARRFELLALGIALLWPAQALAQNTTFALTFEGLQNNEEVLNYYNGGLGGNGSGPGPSYGITFGPGVKALITDEAGGTGQFDMNPSGTTVVNFIKGGGLVMNVPAGFTTGFSLYYASPQPTGTVTVYDGPNATGNILAVMTLATTGIDCNGSTQPYSCWDPVGASFTGTAMSVDFGGLANGIEVDNMTLGSPTPSFGVMVTNASMASGTVGVAYSQAMTVYGGTGPYHWTAQGLPPGLGIDPTTGVVSGTPQTAGTYTVTVTAAETVAPVLVPSTSNSYSVLINPPPIPTLLSLNPSSAVAGSGDLTMQVNGTNFTAAAVVTWTAQTGPPIGLTTTFQSSSVLQATIPAALLANPGIASVTVVIAQVPAFGTLTFTVTTPPAPTLTSLAPDTAVAGSASLTLQANGTNFTPTSVVMWTPQTGPPISLTTTFQSAGVLLATVPAALLAAPGSASVTVVTPHALASTTLAFTITTPPTPMLTSITPSTAVAGSANLTVQVTGTNFSPASLVQWTPEGGTETNLATTFQTATALQAAVPAALLASPGSAAVTVVNPATPASAPLTFTITSPAPTLTSITPATAVAGSAALTIQLNGTNFTQAAVVQWTPQGGAETNLATTFQSATALQAVVPAALLTAPETVSVTVADSATEASGALAFTVTLPAGLNLVIPTPGVLPTDQPSITVNLSAPAPANYAGTIQLNFTPASGVSGWPSNQTNTQVVFAGGTNTTTFTIAQGATTGTLPNDGVFQQGTVAGTITAAITAVNGTELPAGSQPSVTQAVQALAPVITAGSVEITGISSSGFTVSLTAYSTTRDLTIATFTFQPASGATLNGTAQTVTLNSPAATWFSSSGGLQAGGSFTLSAPFAYSGDASALGSVSVTLSNSVGTSAAQTGSTVDAP